MNHCQVMNGPRPFTSVWQAASMLNCTEKQIYHQIQDGRLPLAFDISGPGRERIYLRVATSSVMALQQQRTPPSDLDAFLAEVLPKDNSPTRPRKSRGCWNVIPIISIASLGPTSWRTSAATPVTVSRARAWPAFLHKEKSVSCFFAFF